MLVLAAMDRELRPLLRSLALQRSFIGDEPAWSGAPGGVIAAVVGIGPIVAGETAGRLLEATERLGEPARRVLVLGVAGGVDPALPVGAVLAPAVVVDQATGERYHPDHPAAVESAVGRPSGVLMTSPGLATGAAALAELRAAGVTAVDMETAAVARACQDRGIPWSVLRAVSDRLADGLVDRDVLALTRPDGSTDPLAVAALLLRRPWTVPRLARLGRGAGRAVRAVDRAAVRVLAAEGHGG